MSPDFLASLNERQLEAVTLPHQSALILAGAGSGKTRVLTHRVAWVIRVENASPHSILAVTFTNKAAGEMRGRIETLLGIPGGALWIGTFHGLAHRLLRIHWREAGLQQTFQILDAEDQLRMVRKVLKALDLDNKHIRLKAHGFLARVIQHEVDHLDGILFVDRVEDRSTLFKVSEEELSKGEYAVIGEQPVVAPERTGQDHCPINTDLPDLNGRRILLRAEPLGADD